MSLLAVVRLRVSRNVWVRRAAVQTLAASDGGLAVAALRAALRDPDHDVQNVAIEALGHRGDRPSIVALAALADARRSAGRDRVWLALARIGDPASLDALSRALSPEPSSLALPGDETLVAIAGALGRIGDAGHAPALVPHLTHPRAAVRTEVADALGALGWTPASRRDEAALAVARAEWAKAGACGADALEPLLVALKDAGASRDDVARALGRVGEPAVAPLLRLLVGYDPRVRDASADALRQIAAPAVLPLLDLAMDAKARPIAFEALGSMAGSVEPSSPVAKGLSGRLASRDAGTRALAARAFGLVGTAGAAEPLRGALADADTMVRWTAAAALEKLGAAPVPGDAAWLPFAIARQRWDDVVALGETAVEALLRWLPSRDHTFRWKVIGTLGRIGGARAADTLVGIAHGGDEYDGAEAIDGLVELRDARVLPLLQRDLRDERPQDYGSQRTRLRTVARFERYGGQEGAAGLLDALAASHRDVRKAAATALDALGWQPSTIDESARRCVGLCDWAGVVALGVEAAPALAPAVAEADFATAFPAGEALARIGGAHDVPASLLKGLEHKDSQTTERAVDALGKVDHPRARQALVATLSARHEYLARRAAAVLGWLGAPAADALIAILPAAGKQAGDLAAEALGRIGDRRAVPALIAALPGPSGPAAAYTLAALGDGRAVQPLIDALPVSWDLTAAAAFALGRLGDARAIGPLLARLPDSAAMRRDHTNPIVHAIAALAPQDLDGLLAALDRPGAPIWALALVFGACRETRAVGRLLAGLEAAQGANAHAIATGLGQVGDPRAVPALAARLDATGHCTFADAIVALGDGRGIEPMLRHARRQSGTRYDEYNGTASEASVALAALTTLVERSAATAPTEALEAAASFADLSEMVWHMINGCTRGEYSRGLSCATVRQLARQELLRRRARAESGCHA